MMDRNKLEQLGSELRSIGHRRRELAEQMYSEVEEGEITSSKELLSELSTISERAINLMTQQKQIFDNEVHRLS